MVREKKQRQYAFTLIELLVAVAIIAVLIAVLLPTLGRARESAASAKCLSSLKSMANASAAYTAESDGLLFPGRWAGWGVSPNTQPTYSIKDILKVQQHPYSTKDSKGRLVVGAAIGALAGGTLRVLTDTGHQHSTRHRDNSRAEWMG